MKIIITIINDRLFKNYDVNNSLGLFFYNHCSAFSVLLCFTIDQSSINIYSLEVINVLAGSFEFDKFHNAQIVERPSDPEEVLMVR